MTDPNTLPEVDLDRVVDAMADLGVEVTRSGDSPAGSANLNGIPVTFAPIGSVVIVRADTMSDIPTSSGDATLYLAANHLNSIQMEASATVVDYADHLILRTEHEIFSASGLSDAQLSAALSTAVDGVLRVQDAVRVAAEQFTDRPN